MGKNVSYTPYGINLKKHYCHKCGEKFLITKKDKNDFNSFYQKTNEGDYPKYFYDSNKRHFVCPSCENKISYTEQCIIEVIQKENNNNVLSSSEINSNYEKAKTKSKRNIITLEIIVSTILCLFAISILLFGKTDPSSDALFRAGIGFLLLEGIAVYRIISSYKEKKNVDEVDENGFSEERQNLLSKLYDYSTKNKKLVLQSNKCYCFKCKKSMNSTEISEYTEESEDAICPYCKEEYILPDAIDEPITDELIEDMNKYWFEE